MQRAALEVADIFRVHGPTLRQHQRGHFGQPLTVSAGRGRQLSGRHSAKRLGELCVGRLFFVSLAYKTALKHKATGDP